MATIEDAIEAGVLELFKLPDWEPRLPIRPLYVTPEFVAWVDAKPELHDKKFALGGRLLFEHLLIMFCDFRCAKHCPPHAGDLRRMMPNKNGIWSMHPPKLRVFGWCPGQHTFAAITAALEIDTKKDRKLNDKKHDRVRDFINTYGLESTVLRGDVLAVFPHES